MDGQESLPRHLDGAAAVIDQSFIKIVFQHGPVHAEGVNGCRTEDVVTLLIEKLLDFQGRSMACEENEQAIYHLTQARAALDSRRIKREQQGIVGTLVPHDFNS